MKEFKLESFFEKHEFSAKYLLCCSDAESFSVEDVLAQRANGLQELLKLKLNYISPRGSVELRTAICNLFYPRFGINNILTFSGAQEGIFCALSVLCEKGDEVIVVTPAYQSLIEVPRSKGAEVILFPLDEKDGWKIDFYKLSQLVNFKTKVLVVNFPNNPTGATLSKNEYKQIVDLCSKFGTWIFSDEVYRGLELECEDQSFEFEYSNIVRLGVLSKSFGLPGLRTGWLASRRIDFLEKCLLFKSYTTICNSVLNDYFSYIALQNSEYFLSRNKQLITKNLIELNSFLDLFQDHFIWNQPLAGCIGFIRVDNFSADDFCKEILAKKDVLLLPGSVFGKSYSQFFRVGYGRSNFLEGLSALKEICFDFFSKEY